jgi:hypothetical protein
VLNGVEGSKSDHDGSRVCCEGDGRGGRKSEKVYRRRKVGIMMVGCPVANGQRKFIKLRFQSGVKWTEN